MNFLLLALFFAASAASSQIYYTRYTEIDGIKYKYQETLYYLIEAHNPCLFLKGDGSTLLHRASREHDTKELKMLLKKEENPSTPDNLGRTPLFFAICSSKSSLETIRMLLKKGADPDATFLRVPLLSEAITREKFEVAYELLSWGANVNAPDRSKSTPLHYACSEQWPTEYRINFIRHLIKKGADLTAKNDKGKTPVDLAVKSTKLAKLMREVETLKAWGLLFLL